MKVSIVTPCLQAERFIERTVESVLGQRGAFELEYLVVDGGSTDRTLAILERYRGFLTLSSGPDGGQSDAIDRGFRRAAGDVLAWLNADDLYLPGALDEAVRTLQATGASWCVGGCRIVDEEGRPIRWAVSAYKAWVSRRYSRRRLLGRNFIPQPAVFFRRALYERAGPLDRTLRYSMDYDLWLRFAKVASPARVARELAAFRWHPGSLTAGGYARGAREAWAVATRHARGLERFALLQHAAHAAAEVAVYAALDATGRLLAPRRPLT